MRIQLKLKYKIVALAVCAALLPVIVSLGLTHVRQGPVLEKIDQELTSLARDDVSQIAVDVYNLCKTSNEIIQAGVERALEASEDEAELIGGFSTGSQTVQWTITNQHTGEKTRVLLPRFYLGKTWLHPDFPLSEEAPVVDRTTRMTGTVCSIFQRMNNKGDMLRVSTSIGAGEGKRAIGSFIPADVTSDKQDIVGTVLEGRTYRGFAIAPGGTYITAYRAIFGAGGQIIGMIAIGTKIETLTMLEQTILKTRVGKTGHVWVVGTKGDLKGRYLISKEGNHDGESVWKREDARGRPYVQSLILKSTGTPGGEVSLEYYPLPVTGDYPAREMIAGATYFEPWDWVIVAETDLADFTETERKVMQLLLSFDEWLTIGGGIALVLSSIFAIFLASLITRPLETASHTAEKIAEGDLVRASETLEGASAICKDETGTLLTFLARMIDGLKTLVRQVQHSGIQVTASATQIAASARQLEATVAEQAASTTEVSASTREISSTGKNLLDTVESVAKVTANAGRLAGEGKQSLSGMEDDISILLHAAGAVSDKLSGISDRAENISSIILTITQVADQTNLLSLNAAIEAEKAGEYGLGFSVVAEEIRRLADQTSVAALDIEHMIGEMQGAVGAGVEKMEHFREAVARYETGMSRVTRMMGAIINQIEAIGPRFQTVTEGMRSQSLGADQISKAMEQLAQTAGQSRESLEEFNRAAAGLTDAVRSLQAEVTKFKVG